LSRARAAAPFLALSLLLSAVLPAAANEDPAPPTTPAAGAVIPGQVVVKWRDQQRGPEVAAAHGLAIASEMSGKDLSLPTVVTTNGRPVDQVLSELRADPSVEYAEPDYAVALADDVSVAVAVNDPKTGGQYSLDQMRVRDAWSLSTGGAGIVAVLDTGVQMNHPDLAGRILPGYDFVNGDADASDDNGHGTWVSGIIAANANDGYGIAGISWRDRILPVKIMNGTGSGSTSDLSSGIIWAANNGATVINMSVGGFPYAQYVQDAVNYAWSKGAVLVGAAGNNGRQEDYYPASFANVVSVSATQVDDEFAHWSSYGAKVDVSAPGASVQTTNCYTCTYAGHDTWGSHTYISGTSFATPNVAGVIALIRARYPSWTPQQVVDRLFATVDDRGYAGYDIRYGRGRVNAYRAVGGSPSALGLLGGDALEGNNTLGSARLIGLNTTTRPSIYPAGDVDVMAVDVPRAGRLEVRVTGVVDTRAYPYNRSTLPVDPIVELFNTAGTLLRRVDNEWESGTELATADVSGPTRILVRVSNFYANGNRGAYSITPSFVDNVRPVVSGRGPVDGAVNVSYDGAVVTASFSEPVGGVSSSSVQLRDPSGVVPASVSWDASGNRAVLRPSRALAPETKHTVSVTGSVVDQAGNALAATSWSFTTGKGAPRVSGVDRYATAAALSGSAFGAGVPVAYVATGANFPDALAAGPAARVGGGPLLLTMPSQVPDATRSELARLRPGRIVVIGGPGVVSDGVVATLRGYATSGSVGRIYGTDRYATAAAISGSAFAGGASRVYIATGANYPDALSGGADAARTSSPILLVTPNAIPDSTAAELARLHPGQIVVMGGPGVVSDAIAAKLASYAPSVVRMAGQTRYSTAVALSAASFAANSVDTVYLATGAAFPDGLSAGPVAGLRGGPLLLVPTNSLPPEVAAELQRLDPTNVVFVGGPGVISDALRSQVRALWP
jgi:subtilisin family serine protease/putative cell wall-binding protein